MKKIVYILGSGPSLNDISEKEWKYLEDKETIGFAHIPYKNRKTKYHLATEDFPTDKDALRKIASNGYMDTLIFSHKPETCNIARQLGFNTTMIYPRKGLRNFGGKPWIHNTDVPGKLLDNFGKTIDEPLFTYRGQLSMMLNFAYTLKPSEIRLIGVDLNNDEHFYDDLEECKKLKTFHDNMQKDRPSLIGWNTNKSHATAWPSTGPYGTLVSILEIIKQLKIELNEIDIGIFVCSKKSLLYKDGILKYKGITDV